MAEELPPEEALAGNGVGAEKLRDRARGALWGLAIGDAMGMPTQTMSASQIAETYGAIRGFRVGAPTQPIAPNMPAGSVTDDTEQALLVGKLLIAGRGSISPHDFAESLIAWEDAMREKGSLDLLGPSTKRALDGVRRGEPVEKTGNSGTTNGAAMRVTPVGIAVPLGPDFIQKVIESCQVTHNTSIGIAGAAAIAAAVSAGVEGAGLEDAFAAALEVSERAEHFGTWQEGASIPARFECFSSLAGNLDADGFADFIVRVVGTSVASQESVVAALLIAQRFAGDFVAAVEFAANIGGDTDTVGAMTGAILGAQCGYSRLPEWAVEGIEQAQGLEISVVADGLLRLRRGK